MNRAKGQKIQLHAIHFLVLHTQLFGPIPTFKEVVPCTVLMQWTPDWPFLARTTRSLAERNMYLVPPTVTPFIANWSVLEYLTNQVLLACLVFLVAELNWPYFICGALSRRRISPVQYYFQLSRGHLQQRMDENFRMQKREIRKADLPARCESKIPRLWIGSL